MPIAPYLLRPGGLYWQAVEVLGRVPGIVSSEAFGIPSVSKGMVYISPSGIISTLAFGTLKVGQGFSPVGIPTAEAFGTPKISEILYEPSILSAEAFGTPSVHTGNVDIVLTGIASTEAFGTLQINQKVIIVAIAGEEDFGIFKITLKITVTAGIPTAEAFGTPQTHYVTPAGIATAEAVGTPSLSGNIVLTPTGIASAGAFGTLSVGRGNVNIAPGGIVSGQAFGTAVITTGNVNVAPSGIAGAETFGTLRIIQGLEFKSAVSSLGTSIAIPEHNPGDYLVIAAYRISSTTPPTIPAAGGTVPTWTQIDSYGAQNQSWRTARCVATVSNTTTGIWTNATAIIAIVILGGTAASIGGHGGRAGDNDPTAPAVTMTHTDGSSILLHCFGHRGGTITAWSAAPAGYTKRTSTIGAGGVCLDTKNVTTSDGSVIQSDTGGSQEGSGITIEIVLT